MRGTYIVDSENDCRRLVEVSTLVNLVDIEADDANTGHFRISRGERTANTVLKQGKRLNAQDIVTYANVDLADVWVAGSVIGDRLDWESR